MRESLNRTLARLPRGLKTRFAPSPTGYLHLGHVASAFFVWGIAQAIDAAVVLRIEDHDRQRSREPFTQAILDDLHWLGLIGRQPEYAQQSLHPERYDTALRRLEERGEVYACTCSRSAIVHRQAFASQELLYDGYCRHRAHGRLDAGLRLHLPDTTLAFNDLWQGPQLQNPAKQCGDLLLKERRGSWTYNFCVAVDDGIEGIDFIIRGLDLLEATARQKQLASILGAPHPRFFLHHPLIMNEGGQKLSKRSGSTGLRELKAAGMSAEDVLGLAAASLGFWPHAKPLAAAELGRFFS